MVNTNLKKLTCVFMVLAVLASCKKDGLLDFEGLEHNSEWIFPLLRTEISAEKASKIENIDYDFELNVSDVPFVITGVPVPAISGQTAGPYLLSSPIDELVRFRTDTGRATITITNNFPINIKAGSAVQITNTTNSEVVYSGTLANDIPAMGGIDSLVITNVTLSPWVDSDLEFSISNMGTDGSGGSIPDFNTYDNIHIQFNIEVVQVNEVVLKSTLDYSISDTVDYTFENSDDIASEQEEVFQGAKVNFLVENSVPLDLELQVYFMDQNYLVIDSLLDVSVVESPSIDAAGYAVTSSVEEQKLVLDLTLEEYQALKNDTKFMSFRLGLSSPLSSGEFTIVNNNGVKLIVTSEIKTKISSALSN